MTAVGAADEVRERHLRSRHRPAGEDPHLLLIGDEKLWAQAGHLSRSPTHGQRAVAWRPPAALVQAKLVLLQRAFYSRGRHSRFAPRRRPHPAAPGRCSTARSCSGRPSSPPVCRCGARPTRSLRSLLFGSDAILGGSDADGEDSLLDDVQDIYAFFSGRAGGPAAEPTSPPRSRLWPPARASRAHRSAGARSSGHRGERGAGAARRLRAHPAPAESAVALSRRSSRWRLGLADPLLELAYGVAQRLVRIDARGPGPAPPAPSSSAPDLLLAVTGASGSSRSTRRDRARLMILCARASEDSCSGIPCSTEVRPFSTALRCSQVKCRSPGTSAVANTYGCRATSLSAMPRATSSTIEARIGLRRDLGMEDHLEQQVAQLLAQMISVTGLDGLDRLGGLLDQVLDQRAMGLLGVPRAGLAQPAHHRDQALQLGQRPRGRTGHGRGQEVGGSGWPATPTARARSTSAPGRARRTAG